MNIAEEATEGLRLSVILLHAALNLSERLWGRGRARALAEEVAHRTMQRLHQNSHQTSHQTSHQNSQNSQTSVQNCPRPPRFGKGGDRARKGKGERPGDRSRPY